MVQIQNSPPSNNVIDSNQTPPLSPRSYSVPSPIFTNSTPTTTMNNTRGVGYMQSYVPQSQSLEIYSTVYSPSTSPYYMTPGSLLSEHEVKLEAHTSPHSINSHHHQLSQLSINHHHSRSPSVDEERHLQSQIVSLNRERPSVVNIKME